MRLGRGRTQRLRCPSLGDLEADALYLFSVAGSEPRSRSSLWDLCLADRPAQCLEVLSADGAIVTVSRLGETFNAPLTDESQVAALISGREALYIDISGLSHPAWAQLVRIAISSSVSRVYATYVEPLEYKRHPSPTSASQTFDLSSGFSGIAPIPGFARLRGPADEKDTIFVALLGFEGTRSRLVAQALDPVPPVYPIVGVPGFRPEYAQVALATNQEFLAENRAHANIRYATASCPFEVQEVLGEIYKDSGSKYMYLAPVGTKPHALGAVCYALSHPDTTELMYDHPLRKPDRTSGVGTIHIYRLRG